jgi:chemotaxis protein CheC
MIQLIDDRQMSDFQLDTLREISNIGLGHAVTSLAELTNRRIDMSVPRSGFYPFEGIVDLVGGYEEQIAFVSLKITGEISGLIMFIFNRESTFNLVDMLMGQESGTSHELNEMGQSAVMEVGNILTGSFINAIAGMTGLSVATTVPIFAFDMLGAVLSSLLVATGKIEDQVLVIETRLLQDTLAVKGHFFLLAEHEAIERLFSALAL